MRGAVLFGLETTARGRALVANYLATSACDVQAFRGSVAA